MGNQYVLKLTDTNGVLSKFNFTSSNSDVKVSTSGNTLTITSSKAIARERAVVRNQEDPHSEQQRKADCLWRSVFTGRGYRRGEYSSGAGISECEDSLWPRFRL